MISDDVLDAVFLSELSELLGEGVVAGACAESRHDAMLSGGHEGLVFAGDQLVAETEALLASCISSPQDATGGDVARSTTQTLLKPTQAQLLAEQRQIRKANASKRRHKYNKKLEDERQQLKQQENELSVQLTELQAKKSESKWVLEKTKSMSVWQAIATRQVQGRIKAEAERRRLRILVASRSKVLQELGEKVSQHLNSNAILQDDSASDQNTQLLGIEDAALFERYLAELDATYDQIDDVLGAWRVDEAPLVSRSLDPKRFCGGGVEYVEKLDVQLVPFNFQQTGSAIWQSMRLFHQRKGRRRQHYRGSSDPDNTVTSKIELAKQDDAGERTNLLVWLAIQRRIEPGRTVILWRVSTKGVGKLSDVCAEETGWLVVHPTDSATRSVVGMPTAILTFKRFIPGGINAGVKGGEDNVDKFMQLAESAGDEGRAEVVRMMESLLIDDLRS